MTLRDFMRGKDPFKEKLKKLKNKEFSEEAEEICQLMFVKHLAYKSSIKRYLYILKKEYLFPFIDEGRELFRFKVLKRLGGYDL